MAFNRNEVDDLFTECHRRCCICHQFCGVKMETHHIVPGDNKIENAIPVCLECHAEIGSYNENHPIGRKFTPKELTQHKKQWLDICKDHPEILVKSYMRSDVGPLNALLDELEFNAVVAQDQNVMTISCQFQNSQFKRAVQLGSISILRDELKTAINKVYVSMGRANNYISAAIDKNIGTDPFNKQISYALNFIKEAEPLIHSAIEELLKFLGSEKD